MEKLMDTTSKYENNMVSVIMAAYQSEKYIELSIKSVAAQTYSNWELIVYNDASTDVTAAIVAEKIKRDRRIQIISGIENKGVSFGRNSAIKRAKGRYIALLDSDDIWKPEKLDEQIRFMKEIALFVIHHMSILMKTA